MNYAKHYEQLISRAKIRTLSGYYEVHHIVPKCMGGDDSVSNLVNLTAREHFIAHLLLVKIYPKNKRLLCATAMMCVGQEQRKINNRMYGWLKKNFAEAMSELQTKDKNSQWNTKWIHNLELKVSKKISKDDEVPEGWQLGRVVVFDKKPKVFKKDLIVKETEQFANKLYHIFINGEFSSLRNFAESEYYDKSHVSLIKMWKKYVPSFKENVKHGKKYSPVAQLVVASDC